MQGPVLVSTSSGDQRYLSPVPLKGELILDRT